MHPHYDNALAAGLHHRQLIDDARRNRLNVALRRRARADRLRRRADELDQHAQQAIHRTFT